MNKNFIVLFLICFSGSFYTGFAQEKETAQDSLKLYREIEEFSQKTKITRLIHRLVFRPTGRNKQGATRKFPERNYRAYEGKIIRNLIIISMDPFGYSVIDTTNTPKRWIEKTGNALHNKTMEGTIRDLLLLEENSRLDTLLLKESERLLRRQNYIRSALITAELVGKEEKGGGQVDSVDVTVRVLDSWSIIPVASFSTSRTSLGFLERNFIGTGHELGARFTRQFYDGENAYDVRYSIRNFKNTYINTTIGYNSRLDNSFYKGINIERIFYSPYTTWAGGLYFDQQSRKDSLPDATNVMKNEQFQFNTMDLWGGHSFQIFKGDSENDRTTNLITSARFLRVDFSEKPPEEYDPINFFSSETFYLGSIGISSRQFVKDQYIFHYGIIEDVPVGTIYGLTGGYQRKNNINRPYLGAKISFGDYFEWGFLSTNFEVGSFFNNKNPEQSTISFQANYFTDLVNLGPEWKMRQFLKPQVVWGINRLNTIADRLTLNEYGSTLGVYGPYSYNFNEMGLQGFHSNLYGTKKLILTLQTQFYSPWNVLGFRLNPFINFSTALIGGNSQRINNSKAYSSIGAGFIISNDYLVFDVFQVSFAFYPEIPGRGTNIFRANAFNTEDFGFQDFEFGKPRTVLFK